MRYRPKRWDTETEVTLRAEGRDRIVTVVSVSSTGLRVRGAGGLPKGAAVSVMAGGAELPARVIWTSAEAAGLEFDRPLTRQAMDRAGLRADRPGAAPQG